MTADIVPHLARSLLDHFGLRDWKFRYDNARTRVGLCRHGRKTISLSKHYVALNFAAHYDDVVDTILHEIAHALCEPGEGHGDEWKKMCATTGAKPETCCSEVVAMPPRHLVATCGGCGRKFRRYKKPSKWRKLYCTTCGLQTGALVFRPVALPTATDVMSTAPPPVPITAAPTRLR